MKILVEIAIVAVLAILAARRLQAPWRGRALNVLKGWVTVRAFWLLLTHPIALEDGTRVIAWRLILDQLDRIEAGTFWTFIALAAGVKFIGILASMFRWRTLLVGQGIELPFRHIFGSFLIGRFIGTFLPSTAGLDGYKLYDAARFSGRTVEVAAATALEKVIGVSGIFLSFLVAAPFGYAIFGERGPVILAITVPVALGLIGALLAVLFFPGLIQWFLKTMPLPGRSRLGGLVRRVSEAAAAYRHKQPLVLLALFLSFIVHFTTAAMYYFTALAISATNAEFWPIAFGSSIQIFATVISPFTIAGEGIREAAQYALLGNMIGPAAAIVSAALGFWAAEALTLVGGIFWWIRPSDYRPAYCRVDGQQVDYAAAARVALELESADERERRRAAPASALAPLGVRTRRGAGLGLGTGLLAGLLVGIAESLVIAGGGFGAEAQVLWFGPLAHALVLGGLGLCGGAVLASLPMDEDEIRGWTPSLVMLGTLVPVGLAIALFRIRRDIFAEQMPPLPVLAALLGVAAVVALALFFFGRRVFASPAGRLVRPGVALALVAATALGGAIAAAALAPAGNERAAPPAVPAELATRPNIVLIMVDTLRADHLSCYGATNVETPAMCNLSKDNGTIFNAYSHASWTKPATASLLTSLLPSTHGAMSKPSVLPEGVELLAEVLKERGYATGGIVSNINLAPSFGFDQGYDEYHYLAPDYLGGAAESSSKLILYQIARKVWFKVKPGLRFGDFYQDSAVVNRAAFDWLERHRDSRFFLFLHYMDPHDPYFEHPYDGRAIARVSNPHPDAALAAEMRRLYEGEIEYLDANVGRLLTKLRDLGLRENTVVALTSDHGEEFFEHRGWWHGLTLYDEQIRVPLLIRWAAGARAAPPDATHSLARLVDISPTLLARAGAPIPPAMQGIDLATDPAKRAEKHRRAFAEEDHEGNVLRALRTLEWKLLEANRGNPRGLAERELFRVADDPGETNDLYGEGRSELVLELASHADAHQALAQQAAVGGERTAEISRAECLQLAALGYADMSDCEKMN